MSEPKLISPMLDNFAMGDPISEHNGIRCCPAIRQDTGDKYIVKIISVPSSQSQLDALLLSGAYCDKDAALSYFSEITNDITEEVETLQKLSRLDGFVPFESYQTVPMDDGTGFEIYLLNTYKKTLKNYLKQGLMTQLCAVNLGLDLCSALSSSRRSGYLYVDLKPDNIYLVGEREFRIGDIGFLPLNSLKHISLPDRYRSQYTAPEIQDAFSLLNSTIDVYAVGLILYQAFNDGILPFSADSSHEEILPSPAYADYEMAEIILKACSPNPADRWQDPIEMGQALVSYMQRNGANDTPIVPIPVETLCDNDQQSDSIDPTTGIKSNIEDSSSTVSGKQEENLAIDDGENPSTFSDSTFTDSDLDQDANEIDYNEVSEEVSDILEQADDLIAHPTPDPVVQPDPIDVPMPPPLPIEEEPDNDEIEENISEYTVSSENTTETDTVDEIISLEENIEEVESKKLPGHWIRNSIFAVVALILLALGFLYYKNFYLQPIESIVLEENENGSLHVYVTSRTDENKLTVICSDTYGNQLKSPVINGKAVFTDLAPNSAFYVNVIIDGFHRLTGATSTAFTTPVQTNIVQFNAVAGSEDGSAIISFTIDGPDTELWKIKYTAEGEPEKETTFSGHMITLNGLSVGKTYTFNLNPVKNMHIAGLNEIQHTVTTIVRAENLTITGCINNVLTATWTSPAEANVNHWIVRCYNDNGYDETLVVNDTKVSFASIDPSKSYTVEVTASGMSVSQRVFAPANSITVTDFTAEDSDPNTIMLSWKNAEKEPQGGWLLLYSIDGSAVKELKCLENNTAVLDTKIPGVCYTFTLQAADGSPVLGGVLEYKTADASPFSGYNVTADSMVFEMCKRPKNKNWDRYDLKKSDYTTTFEVGQKISFLVRVKKDYTTSSDLINTLFVIRDANGTIVNTSSVSNKWKSMWYRSYCELDIPSIPKTPGDYTISIYFNSCIANEQSFKIVA